MGYDKVISAHRRITILRLLAEQQDYSLNDSIIKDLLPEYGFRPSRSVVRTELAWLAEQGLVTVKDVNGCHTATLTERGGEVADGCATVPGVKRPSPGEL
jgi:repressor of nif and glnA expression